MIKNNKGFTLVELMLVVAVLGILFSVLYTALNFNMHWLYQKNRVADGHLQGMVATERITHLFRQYQNIEVDGQNVLAGNVKLLNFARNTSPRSDYRYYFFWDDQSQRGELRNSTDGVVVAGLKNIDIAQSGETIVITITMLNSDSEDDFTLTTSLRTNRQFPSKGD